MKLIIAGWLIHVAFASLCQDALGKQGYIDAIERHWWPARVTVPLAIAAITIAAWLIWGS